jgi:hypothetical protein
VLHREQTQQPEINQERGNEPHGRRGIERARHAKIADEADGVEKGGEEDHVADHAVEEDGQAFEHD